MKTNRMWLKRAAMLPAMAACGLMANMTLADDVIVHGESGHANTQQAMVTINGTNYYNRALMSEAQMQSFATSDMTIPVKLCDAKASSAPGYPAPGSARNCCEYISKATFTKLETGEMKIQITIAMPGLLSFDDTTVYWDHNLISEKGAYSEHVHVWIDWNGDKKWSDSEMVMAASQKDYRALSNNRTLNFSKTVKIPSGSVAETYARVILSWGDSITNPEARSWMWGDVVDKDIHIGFEPPVITKIWSPSVQSHSEYSSQSTRDKNYGYAVAGGAPTSFNIEVKFSKGDTVNIDHYEFDFGGTRWFTMHPKKVLSKDFNRSKQYDYVTFEIEVSAKREIELRPDDFGGKHIEIGYKACSSTTCGVEQKVPFLIYLFFKRTDKTTKETGVHSVSVPNWFYYWKKYSAVPSLRDSRIVYAEVGYTGRTISAGQYDSNEKKILIGPKATNNYKRGEIYYPWSPLINKYNNNLKESFEPAVDKESLVRTIIHEKEHKKHDDSGWYSSSQIDIDHDNIPDGIEASTYARYQFGISSTKEGDVFPSADSYNLKRIANSYTTYGDEELLARIAERDTRVNGSSMDDNADWAYPGVNFENKFGASGVAVRSVGHVPISSVDDFELPTISLLSDYSTLNYDKSGLITQLCWNVVADVSNICDSVVIDASAILYSGTNIVTYQIFSPILTNGICNIAVPFHGSSIREQGYDGPYSCYFELNGSGDRDPINICATNMSCDVTDVRAFSKRRISILSVSEDYSDERGIIVPVNIDSEGTNSCLILASLYSVDSSNVVAQAKTSCENVSGFKNIELVFPAVDIYENKQDGGFVVREIVIDDGAETKSELKEWKLNNDYHYSQFRGQNAILSILPEISLSAYGKDAAGFDRSLRLDLEIENKSQSPDLYFIEANLITMSGNIVASIRQNIQLPLLNNSISLYFSGVDIFESGFNGPYQIQTISLYDIAKGEILDTTHPKYTSEEYEFSQFSHQPFVVDSSSIYFSTYRENDLIKRIDTSISLQIQTEGEVTITASLVDSNGVFVASSSLSEFREAGVATFNLPFQGGDIFASGLNGPYRIVNLCVSHSSEPDYTYEEAETTMVTEAYKYDDFLPLSELYGNIPTEGLVYQLDASNPHSITTNENAEVLEWFSTDGLIRFATDEKSGGRPCYIKDAFGGKGGILFGSNTVTKAVGSSRMATTTDTDNQTVFVVTKPTRSQNSYAGVWGFDGNTMGFSAGYTSWYSYSFPSTGALYKDGTVAYGNAALDVNEPQILTAVSGSIQNFATAIGNFYNSTNYPDRYYVGEIAEILVYDRTLTDVERLNVEAFLQKKWISDEKTLFVTPETFMLTSDGVQTNTVVVSLTDWEASSDADWLHLGETHGSGITNLPFSVEENTSGVSRAATITISNATSVTQCQVIQYFKDYYDTDIDFSKPMTISGDNDVRTDGTLVAAYCVSYPRTVNGVAFTSSRGTTFDAKSWWSGGNYSGGTASPWANLSENYRYILQSAFGTQTLYLKNLEIGQAYLVQLWSNNSTSNGVSGVMSVASGKHGVSLRQNSTGAYGGVGQYTVGYFVADQPIKTISMSGNYLFNAIQLRKIAAMPTHRVEITDSVKSFIDKSIGYGEVMVGLSKRESLTIKNTSSSQSLTVNGVQTSFREDFNDGEAQYWMPDREESWSVVNGAYRASNPAIDSKMFSMYSGCEFSDVAVQVDCWREGRSSSSQGIVLRATADFDSNSGSGYMFFITDDGMFSVWKFVNGSSSALKSWTTSSALSSPTNTLIASASGEELSFYINGKRVWRGVDSSVAHGRIGIGGYTTPSEPTTYYFDNVIQGGPIAASSSDLAEVQSTGYQYGGSPWEAPASPSTVSASEPEASDGPQSISLDEPVFRVLTDVTFPVVLPPGASQTFDIDFVPSTLGKVSSTAIIFTDDPIDGVLSVDLNGCGISDYLTLHQGARTLRFSGHPGGPFDPTVQTLVISNHAAAAQNWSILVPTWLGVSSASGTTEANAMTELSVSVNAAGASLPSGTYSDVIAVSNSETTLTTTCPVVLDVYTSSSVTLSPSAIVVTNRMGQIQTRTMTLGNAATADASLDATISAYETSRKIDEPTGAMSMSAMSLASATATPKEDDEETEDFTMPQGVEFQDAQVLMRIKDAKLSDAEIEAMLAQAGGGKIVRRYKLVPGLVLVRVPKAVANSEEMEQVVRRFNAVRGVRYAHPNYRQKALKIPDDPRFDDLWGMKNLGQTGGKEGADIDAPLAWDQVTGNASIIVGVIDSGVDYTHEDLAANMWVNHGEIPGDGIDNDGNGYVDDVYGINAIENSGDPMDDEGHGTHCAGTIAAVGNNGIGVAGVCWAAKIMALKFLDSDGYGDTANSLACIEYAILNGAKVLSNSWGGGPYSTALKEMIDAAGDAGVVFVAAAGNDYGVNNDVTPQYPANYNCANIISVMSTDSQDKRSTFSNYGPSTVHLGAPGSSILSCKLGGGYVYKSGTSMATPHVSGAAALLLSVNRSLAPTDVKTLLMDSGDPVLTGQCLSGKRMNIGRAVGRTTQWLKVAPERIRSLNPGADEQITLTFDAGYNEAGTYDGEVSVLGNGRDVMSAKSSVRMVVVPDEIRITPTTTFTVTGREAGPFTPQKLTYVLKNTDATSVEWEASSSNTWLRISLSEGTLASGESKEVEVLISDAANGCPIGTHLGYVYFRNRTSGAVQRRQIELKVENAPGPIYVDAVHGDDNASGRSWATAKQSIQAALSRAISGDWIVVTNGVYGPIENYDLPISITSVNGPQYTFIDGNNEMRCATFADSYYIWEDEYQTDTVLSGFTLMNGNETYDYYGGGVLGGLITNCIIRANRAGDGAGACHAVLTDCIIAANYAEDYGGAAYRCKLENCYIVKNRARYDGGGIYNSDAVGCVIRNNNGQYGGGVSDSSVVNSLILGNEANYGGGAYDSSLENCTVYGNVVQYGGGGTYYTQITNTIVWGNTNKQGAKRNCDGGSAISSCIEEPTSYYNSQIERVSGCITSDPKFADASKGVFKLLSGSPCLDSGIETSSDCEYDLNGDTRIVNGHIDMGAYEGVVDGHVISVSIEGVGHVNRQFAIVNDGGSAVFVAEELGRPFVCFKTNGVIATTSNVIEWRDVKANGTLTATFDKFDLFVDANNGEDSADGMSWANAKRTIDAAISLANDGETIWVTNGVYSSINTDGRELYIYSVNGPLETIIDGYGYARCATLGSDSTSMSFLRGFTLQNGFTSGSGGGAMYGTLCECVIQDNEATMQGGGVYYSTLSNCIVRNNHALNNGGGTYYGTAVGSTIIGNRAGQNGGGTYYGTIRNGIVLGNKSTNAEYDNYYYGSYYYSCSAPIHSGTGNILGDALSVVDAVNGDARLRVGSGCINSGYNAYVISDNDIIGAQRIQGGCVDMGAYEGMAVSGYVITVRVRGDGSVSPYTAVVEPGGSASFSAIAADRSFVRFLTNGVFATESASFVWDNVQEDGVLTAVFDTHDFYVDCSTEETTGDGKSWERPYGSLQRAVTEAIDGETIWVKPGVYGPISSGNKTIAIRSIEGPDVTVIDGGGTSRCASLGSYSSHRETILDGFTLRNGKATSGAGSYGGTLTNCVIRDNTATGSWSTYGGGTYYGELSRCVISNNRSEGTGYGYGGGCYYGTLRNCIISNNIAVGPNYAYGGACYYSTVYNSELVDNIASNSSVTSGRAYGGATYYGTTYNCLIVGNAALGVAASFGGATYYGTHRNDTIYGNAVTDTGTSAGVYYGSIYNCIVWENRKVNSTLANHNSSTMYYSCSNPRPSGTANINSDPRFRNAALGNYHLADNSPCVNAGYNSYATGTYDLFGRPRILNTTVDMGAYEWVGTVTTPIITPANGTVFKGDAQKVKITCNTEAAVIYYTLDGTEPTENSTLYTKAFNIKDTTTVKAIAYADLKWESAVAVSQITKMVYENDSLLAEALDVPTWDVITDVTYPWTRVVNISSDGQDSAQSGMSMDNTTSWMQTTVTGKGILTFMWKTSCEDDPEYDNWDHVRFLVDGAEMARADGETDWTKVTIDLSTDKVHILRWEYVKDFSDAEGEDCAWVDHVSWKPADLIPAITSDNEVSAALAGSVDSGLSVNVTNVVQYAAYRTWALSVTNSTTTTRIIKESTRTWLSFALGADALIDKDLTSDDVKIESFTPTSTDGKFEFTVSVKDVNIGGGSVAIETLKANLKSVLGIEGASTLSPDAFSSDNTEITFDTPVDGKAKFTATPPADAGNSFFMRVKVK